MSEPPARSDFAAASTTLRETVKWLAAAFAGTAALIIGSTPLSGFGKLPPAQAWTALGFLVAGLLLICAALWRTLRILKPDVLYRSDLLGTHDPAPGSSALEELNALRSTINQHGADLLPPEAASLGAMATALATIDEGIEQGQKNQSPQQVEQGEALRAAYWAEVDQVLPLAQYLRLQRRFEKEQIWMALLSVAALLSLLGFVKASTVPDKDTPPIAHPITIHNSCPGPCEARPPPVALPSLPAILFVHDQASVTETGRLAIQMARDEMQNHPRALLLLQAHTDTASPLKHNEDLAQRRALEVLPLLSRHGGIAPNRLLVSYLPETALPHVTADRKPDAQNRSVRLVMIDDTRR